MRKDKKVIGICVASMQSDSWEKHVRAICKEAGKRDYTVMIFNRSEEHTSELQSR